jgi:hypothetical protein
MGIMIIMMEAPSRKQAHNEHDNHGDYYEYPGRKAADEKVADGFGQAELGNGIAEEHSATDNEGDHYCAG